MIGTDVVAVAAAVFIVTYFLIAVEKLPKVRIERWMAAVLGAVLMLVFGIISIDAAFRSIDFDVILLLIGMMLLVAGMEYCGFFTVVSEYLVERSSSRFKLLALIMAITAFLSAVALNDAVVLMFTPIVVKCCRKIEANPIPYLVGMMMSANIGSMCTAVGNPQNAYIASVAGIDFLTFSMYLVPVTLVCLPVAMAMLALIYKNDMTVPYTGNYIMSDSATPVDSDRVKAILAVAALAFIGFAISGIIDVKTWIIAFTAGILALIIVSTKRLDASVWMVRRVDWSIIAFFIGLFIVMGAVSSSGLLGEIADLFPGFGAGETPSMIGLTVFSAILSNLVSNVPAVMLIAEMMPADDLGLWLMLAASSTLAGNATLLGSAANIIVAEKSDHLGVKVSFLRFLIAGVPVTIVTLIIATAMLSLLF